MKKIIMFNARFSYQYYTEEGKWIDKDHLIRLLTEQADVEVVKEGDGTKEKR